MATKKISELDDSAVIDGTELVPIVKGGANKKITIVRTVEEGLTKIGASVSSIRIGLNAGAAITVEDKNIAIGVYALEEAAGLEELTAIGYSALANNVNTM